MPVRILKPLYHENHASSKRIRGRKLQQLRQRIFVAHGFRCAKCGRLTTDLELDHIRELADGGTNDDDNLQPLCKDPCHIEKRRGRGGANL